jgi:hypothetical protein
MVDSIIFKNFMKEPGTWNLLKLNITHFLFNILEHATILWRIIKIIV